MTQLRRRRSPRWRAAAVTATLVGLSAIVITHAMSAFANTTLTATYTSSGVGHGSPYVFGGNISNLNLSDPIDNPYTFKLPGAGVTLIRDTVYLDGIVPNTTVTNYLNNVGGVQNPANWNWGPYSWIGTQHADGMKVMMIVGYDAHWLSDNGDIHGVPSNWTVYQDIVTKIHQHFQGMVDYVEIWNEPESTGFLNLSGSNYTDSLTAYEDIYSHAANAIRAVDTTIPIGGPVTFTPSHTNWLDGLLTNPATSSNVNFVSYHDYQAGTSNESVTAWQQEAARDGHPNLPVFVTEWNNDPAGGAIDSNSTAAIGYQANRLTNFYKQGAAGAALFAMDSFGQFTGFYFVDSLGDLVPAAGAFRLMSRDLGLGAGTSTIQQISRSGTLANAGAARNSSGTDVAWLVNTSNAPETDTVNFNGVANGSYTAQVYEASATNSALTPREAHPVTVTNGTAQLTTLTPPGSVVGIALGPVVTSNGYNIYQLGSGMSWNQQNGQAVRIAVGPDGTSWVVNSIGNLYKLSNGSWQLVRSGDTADVAVGVNATVAIALDGAANETILYSTNGGTTWTSTGGQGTAVAVDSVGHIWAVATNTPGDLDVYNFSTWQKVRSGDTQDVSVGGNGEIAISLIDGLDDTILYSTDGARTWSSTAGGQGTAVSVDSAGHVWTVALNSPGDVDEWINGSWTRFRNGGAHDVGASPTIASDVWITSS